MLNGAGKIDLGDQQLEYRFISGDQLKPVLVLLHEGLGCVRLWKQFPQALNQATGHPVFVYSRAGYGESSGVELPRPIDFHRREGVDVLPRLLDTLEFEQVIMLGHSDGASIAITYAGSAPRPVLRGLILLAPHIVAEPKGIENILSVREQYQTTDLRSRLARYHGNNVDSAFLGWADTWLDPRFADWSIAACLDTITVPVLAIRGADDPYNTGFHVEEIGRRVAASAELMQLAQCAHAPQFEAAERVMVAVTAFIKRVSDDVAS